MRSVTKNSQLGCSELLRSSRGGVAAHLRAPARGGLVLLHDPLLSIGTTLSGWAHERSSVEIAAAWLRGRDGAAGEERPLLLDALLDRVPAGLTLQLEVKAHADPNLARRTALAICARCRRDRDRVEVTSFHTAACEAAAAQGFRSRLVVFADYQPEALAAWAVARGVAGVSVEHFLLTERTMRPLRLAGLGVNTGTVNEPELLERALALSPDSICTDRPHEIAAWARRAERPVADSASFRKARRRSRLCRPSPVGASWGTP